MNSRRCLVIFVAAAATLCLTLAVSAAEPQAQDSKPAAVKSSAIKASRQAPDPANSRLAAPKPGPLDYICNSGNCACAGVQDCVDMKDICAPGTMGCNKHGCTCKEGDSGDGG